MLQQAHATFTLNTTQCARTATDDTSTDHFRLRFAQHYHCTTSLLQQAIDDFLKQGNLSYIVRAHEAHSEGVSLSKGAKVFTVFSTSKVTNHQPLQRFVQKASSTKMIVRAVMVGTPVQKCAHTAA
jgi:hypothetical protein